MSRQETESERMDSEREDVEGAQDGEDTQQTLSTAHSPEQGAGRTSVSAPLFRRVEGTVHATALRQESHSREQQERRRLRDPY